MDVGGIENLGLDRVIRRGSAEIITERDDALLIRDTVSGAYLFACRDEALGISVLDRYIGEGCGLLMVSDVSLGRAAYGRYGFREKLECYQVAYYGDVPSADGALSVRTAEEKDLPLIAEHHDLISREELGRVVGRGSVLLGYHEGRLAGFIGEHLEGSMGLLYVLPEFRHRGFGAALQTHLIIRTMERGFVPFGQVEKNNTASLRLQEKLGMTRSDSLIVWMWR